MKGTDKKEQRLRLGIQCNLFKIEEIKKKNSTTKGFQHLIKEGKRVNGKFGEIFTGIIVGFFG